MNGDCLSCGAPGMAGTTHACSPFLQHPVIPPRAPYRCPICNGRGQVPCDFYTAFGVASGTNPQTCRACGGRGVVIA